MEDLAGSALFNPFAYEAGHHALTPGELVFVSVYRYKGRQSPAMILVDIDFRDWRDERSRRVLYTGVTRTAVHVCVATLATS